MFQSDAFNSCAAGPSHKLAQSLHHKIIEAKSLQLAKETCSKSESSKKTIPALVDLTFTHRSQANARATSNLPLSSEAQTVSTPLEGLEAIVPVPHTKPVMPTLPPLSSSPSVRRMKTQEKGDTIALIARNATPQMSESSRIDAIDTANAARSIQLMWREKLRKCEKYEHTHVRRNTNLHLNKVNALFCAANATAMTPRQTNEVISQDANTEYMVKSSWVRDFKGDVTAPLTASPMSRRVTYCPWIDHELIFLEEGRCMGEIYSSVQNSFCEDQDELLWKRPQQVIQQVEYRRISKIQKMEQLGRNGNDQRMLNVDSNYRALESNVSSLKGGTSTSLLSFVENPSAATPSLGLQKSLRKQKLPRVSLPSHKWGCHKSSTRTKKTTKTRRKKTISKRSNEKAAIRGSLQLNDNLDRRERRRSDDTPGIEIVARDCRTMEQNVTVDTALNPDVLNQFKVFSNFNQPLNDDTKQSRNDLISVGDFAFARNGLDVHHLCHTASDTIEIEQNKSIPLTLSALPAYQDQVLGKLDFQVLKPRREPTMFAETSRAEGGSDKGTTDRCYSEVPAFKDDGNCSNESSDKLHCKLSLAWKELLKYSDESSLSPIRDNVSLKSYALHEAISISPRHSTDSMRALACTKYSVDGTKFQNYGEDGNTQLLQTGPSSQSSPSAALSSGHCSIEKERTEFQSVLNDFKCCLQPLLPCPSKLSLSPSISLKLK